ncbi:MAG: DUF6115 domain-containing protein [Desulfomonilia bacterium]
MNLPEPTKILLLIQIIIQIILIGFVVFLVFSEKKKKISPGVLDELKDILKETQELSDTFHAQVQAKIEVVSRVIRDLDQKIKEADSRIKILEETSLKAKNSRQFSREDVLRLSSAGYDSLSIAQITGIPVGEVQLMIKVKEQEGTA